jgi:hypothetical protein
VRFRFRPKVFVGWLATYLLVLLLPILVSGAALYQSVRIVRREAERANEALVSQLRTVIDT